MDISPIQFIPMTMYPNLSAALNDQNDKYLSIVGWDGAAGVGSITMTGIFKKSCILFHFTDGTLYQNSAADGAAPTWVQFTNLVPGANTITTAMLQAASVTLAKLAAGITPSHVAKFGGKITWSGSGATLATAVTGVLSTDIVIATIQVPPTQAAFLKNATPTTDTITLALSAANTSNDAVIGYTVFRAAA